MHLSVERVVRVVSTSAVFATLLLGSGARAATFVVMSTVDEPDAVVGDGVCATAAGACTLRAAVEEANASVAHDSVVVSWGEYVLTRGPLVLTGEIELMGVRTDGAVIDGNGASRVLELVVSGSRPARVRLFQLTIQNGFARAPDAHGGGVLSDDPRNVLQVQRTQVFGNRAQGSGGGIYSAGTLEIWRSAIHYNESDPDETGDPEAAGGGVYNAGAVAWLDRSSFHGNTAARGAGLANESGTVSIWSSTFSENVARARGGAISNTPTTEGAVAQTTLAFSTIVDNAVTSSGRGGGIYNAGELRLANSILALNRDNRSADSVQYAPDCVSEPLPGRVADEVSVESLGGLVLGVYTDQCLHAAHASDQRGAVWAPLDPGLYDASYREYDVTLGFEPREDSVVVGAASDASGFACAARDQWGYMRPEAELDCDSGAIEQGGESRRRSAMLVVADQNFVPTDAVLAVKLSDAGFDVFSEPADALTAEVNERSVAVISETVTSSDLPPWLRDIRRPILSLEPAVLDELGMTDDAWGRTQGEAWPQARLRIAADGPIDSGLRGTVTVTDSRARFGWGVPASSDAFKVAALATAPRYWTVFGYEAGACLADGSRAAAARVAFLALDGTPQRMNANGWQLFYATLDYLVPPP